MKLNDDFAFEERDAFAEEASEMTDVDLMLYVDHATAGAAQTAPRFRQVIDELLYRFSQYIQQNQN